MAGPGRSPSDPPASEAEERGQRTHPSFRL